MRFNWKVTRAHRLASFARPERLRNYHPREACHLEADVVDVATGRVLLRECDLALPGVAGLGFVRDYCSAWAHRPSALGPGWSHGFEQRAWAERDRIVVRAGDGRELEFDTLGWRERGEEIVRDALMGATLRRLAPQRYRVDLRDGSGAEFEPGGGETASGPSRLRAVRTTRGQVLTCEHDRAGRVVQVRDAAGRTLVLEHESDGRLVQLVVAGSGQRAGTVWARFEHDERGMLARVTDARGHALTYEYNGELLVARRDRCGHGTWFGYDGRDGQARCVRTWREGGARDRTLSYIPERFRAMATDARGRSRTFACNAINQLTEIGGVGALTYDDEGRVVTRRDPEGRAIEYTLDEHGHVARAQRHDGTSRAYLRDPEGRVLERTDEQGQRWTYARDAAGRVLQQRDPTGLARDFEWRAGLLRAVVDGSVRRTEFGYDDALNLVRVRAAHGLVTEIARDALGFPVEVRSSDGTHLALRWDAGLLVEVRERAGRAATLEYDPERRLSAFREGERVVRYAWGPCGELLERDEDGERLGLEYDPEGALIRVRADGVERARFVRDKLGRVVEEHAGDGAVYKYKHQGATTRVRKVTLPGGERAEFDYDASDRVVRVRRSDARNERYEYDRCGRVVMAALGDESLVRLSRDAAGRVVRESSGEAAWVAARWDPQGSRVEVRSSLGARVVTVRDEAGLARTVVVGTVSAPSFRADLQHDAAGRELSRAMGATRATLQRDDGGRVRTCAIAHEDAPRDAVHLLWDPRGRLSAVADRWGVHRIGRNAQGRAVRFATDGGAALLRLWNAAGDVFRAPDVSDREYSPGGQLRAGDGATLEYDRAGQVRAVRTAWGDVWTYRYDALGLLREVRRPDGQVVQFNYDAFGRRDGLSVGEREALWIWDGDALLHELRTREPERLWVQTPESAEPLGLVVGERALLAVHPGVEGEVRVVDADGNLALAALVDLFGAPLRTEGDAPWPFRWTGHHADAETGLQYARYRYLMPSFGRYLTRNPRGLGGLAYGYAHIGDPTQERAPEGLGPEFEPAPRAAGEPGTPPSFLLATRTSEGELARYVRWLARTGWIEPDAPVPSIADLPRESEGE